MLTKNKDQRPSMTDTADDLAKLLSKLSGSSVMLRSQALIVAPVDGSRVQAAVQPSTTLGRSIGQQSSGISTSMRRLLGVGTAALALALALAVALFGAVRLGSSSMTTAASPNSARLLPAPPTQPDSLREAPAQQGETIRVEALTLSAAAPSGRATESKPVDGSAAAAQGQSPRRTQQQPVRDSQPAEPAAGRRKPKYLSEQSHFWQDRKKLRPTFQIKPTTSAPPRKRIDYEE
jgi:hypothetical protein